MFENILNLTLDLVHLATHRDLFMCLLTFNSRKFLIEIINQFAVQITDNEPLIKKYADLLNFLDSKEVFSYKAGSNVPTGSQTGSVGGSASSAQMSYNSSFTSLTTLASNSLMQRNPSSANLNQGNLDEAAMIFHKFKDSFYELVYKFPYANYLKVIFFQTATR
jgi:hypothetical protein